ncbi:MAG: DUF3795 domain-containing protein [Candidatus Firestonebacteria bacterium]
MKQMRIYPIIGVCGLDCGLCPRYYTIGSSRCPGCCGPDFFNKHPACSYITCCVKKRNLEVCAECHEFPCSKFKSDEEYQQLKQSSSYPPYNKVMSNLNFIKEHGIKKFIEQQKKRIKLLKTMIDNFNDGRSKSFYCTSASLLTITSLEKSLAEANRRVKIDKVKSRRLKPATTTKSKILKEILNDFAANERIELK